MFEQVRILLEKYYCTLLRKGMSLRAENLLHEVRSRLRMLEWLHQRLVSLDRDLEAEGRAQLPASAPAPDVFKQVFTDSERPDCADFRHARLSASNADELRILLEAFYYCAHRTRDIFRDSGSELPGMSAFESVGVRNVRNHLVEHPAGKEGVIVNTFAAGGPVGPELKPLRWSLDPEGTKDAGLHANAAEFVTSLEKMLESAIAGAA